MASKPAGGRGTIDLASFAGVIVGIGCLIGGLILEGGKIKDVAQVTAAIIVLGGTLGAVMISMPMSVLVAALKSIPMLFFEKSLGAEKTLEDIIGYATKARKNGIVSLESDAEQITDPFLGKALTLAIDGTDLQEIRKMMELEISMQEHHMEATAKVYEAAGGYSPTIGIIGAVMGLIQVMKHLDNIEEVGHGIAVAFVATIYGVGLANLFCLPAAAKIKSRAAHQTQVREMVLEGVIGIVEGLNPKLIRSKLEAFAPPSANKKKAAAAKTAADSRAAEASA
jgi:chemotaxis protein MotA